MQSLDIAMPGIAAPGTIIAMSEDALAGIAAQLGAAAAKITPSATTTETNCLSNSLGKGLGSMGPIICQVGLKYKKASGRESSIDRAP
jgi:hypothetical protein